MGAQLHINDSTESQSARHTDVTEILSAPLRGRERIDYLAGQIRLLGAGNTPKDVLRLGELVYRELYGGGRSLQQKDRHASLRRIAAHPDVPFKVTTIWRAVSVYEMSLRLPHLLHAPGLGVSHLRAVIGLDPAHQELLLTLATRERWTKRRLEQEAARHRSTDRRKGRRPLPQLIAWTRELERMLERSQELNPADLRGQQATLLEAQQVLERFSARLTTLKDQVSNELSPSASVSELDRVGT
ncbi:MAG TPA: hypothetical protein VLC09_19555 [Polyangiaceae bacterium]|nr:hypothetical protein [Polyangiaceae bacterium]